MKLYEKYNGFVIDTHVHTSEGSACATLSAAKQVKQYRDVGYNGIIITDHFINGNSAVDRMLPWEEQMKWQFSGYREAAKAAEGTDFKVFCGIEYAYHGTEFIVLGLGEEWFINHREVTQMGPQQFLPYFLSEGAAIIQVHPYREETYINEIRLYPELVHAIEAFNLGNKKDIWNDRAFKLAERYNKPKVAGSDCHHLGKTGAGIVLENAPQTLEDLMNTIKSGKGWTHFGEFGKEL